MTEKLQNEQTASNAQTDLNGYIPVSKWNEYHKYPTEKTLRQLIFYKKKYNFAKVIRKVAGRLYISEKEFYNWIEETGRVDA